MYYNIVKRAVIYSAPHSLSTKFQYTYAYSCDTLVRQSLSNKVCSIITIVSRSIVLSRYYYSTVSERVDDTDKVKSRPFGDIQPLIQPQALP